MIPPNLIWVMCLLLRFHLLPYWILVAGYKTIVNIVRLSSSRCWPKWLMYSASELASRNAKSWTSASTNQINLLIMLLPHLSYKEQLLDDIAKRCIKVKGITHSLMFFIYRMISLVSSLVGPFSPQWTRCHIEHNAV